MAAASLAERTLACHAGMPMATSMPMIEMTIINSTSEKPFRRGLFLFSLIISKPHCLKYTCDSCPGSTKRRLIGGRRRGGDLPTRKILLHGTAQVTPASKEGKSKKAKGKRKKAGGNLLPFSRAARHFPPAGHARGRLLLLPFAFLLLPYRMGRA